MPFPSGLFGYARVRLREFIPNTPLALITALSLLGVFNRNLSMSYDLGIDYVHIAQSPLSDILTNLIPDQMPLYFIILKSWMLFFGSSEAAVRIFLSVFLFLLVGFTYHCTLRLSKNRDAALLASLMAGLHPSILWFTLDPKHWMVLASATMAALYFFIRYLEEKNTKNIILYGVFSVLPAAISFVGAAITTGFLLATAYLLFRGMIPREKALIPLILMVLFLMYSAGRIMDSRHYFAENQPPSKSSINSHDPAGYLEDVFHNLYLIDGRGYATSLFLALLVLTAACGFYRNRGSFTHQLILLWIMLLFSGGYLASMHTAVRERYMIPALPLIFLLSSSAVFSIRERSVKSALLIVFFLSAIGFYMDFTASADFIDWKSAGKTVLSERTPDDGVIVVAKSFSESFREIYLGIPAETYGHIEEVIWPPKNEVFLVLQEPGRDRQWILESLSPQFNITGSWRFNRIEVFKLLRAVEAGELFSRNIGLNDRKSLVENKARITKKRVDGYLRGCILLNAKDGEGVLVRFPDQEIRKSLTIHAGVIDESALAGQYPSQVYIKTLIDGVQVDEFIVPPVRGYFSRRINTENHEGGRGLSFRISSDNSFRRDLCFNAATSDSNVVERDDYFYRNLDEAYVYAESWVSDGKDGITPCRHLRRDSIYPHNETRPPFREGKFFTRHDCLPKDEISDKLWMTYAQGFDRSAGDFRRAIFIHPHPNATLTAQYRNAPLKGSLTGYYGINDLAFEKMGSNNIAFSIFVDGEQVYSAVQGRLPGWSEFEVNGLPKGLHEVSFTVEAEKTRWTHFYFNAFI